MTGQAPAVIFRTAAQTQIVQAQAWYELQRAGLGVEFAFSVEATIARVTRQPLAAPVVYEDVDRVVLKRFPYSVFYLIEPQRLVVLSCLHTRRNPAAWP